MYQKRILPVAIFCFMMMAICSPFVFTKEQPKPLTKKPVVNQKQQVDFQRDIQPIFKAHCYQCHDAKTQEGGLRIHLRKNAMAGGDNGVVIIPGKSEKSLLYQRVAGIGDDERMPPEDEADSLSKNQIELIKRWIQQGANWPHEADKNIQGVNHWAYKKPKLPALPKVKNPAWANNPIDYFVLAKLDKHDLLPNEQFDRARLLRRASISLIGLPPTIQQVDQFVDDQRPAAYRRAIERLLASPAYGERWAALWLDLARYADTQGYEKDSRRTIWRYRDWVIDAINADMPFDQFTIQQLAGDLLPKATDEQKIATAFHRNTMTNTEGGTDDEEFRHEAVIDRINTTMQLWMGTTFNCCQCHSHKYDPFTQSEYYEMFAIFNQTDDRDRSNEHPILSTYTRLQDRQRATLQNAISQLQTSLKVKNADPKTKKSLTQMLTNLKKQLASIKPTTLPIYKELPKGKQRTTHIHIRGSFLAKGRKVQPGIPAVLHKFESKAPLNRLDFSKWLMSRENPLVARVIVNRYWEQLFGIGLVSTSEDFGTQGERPSHPELLDWLAVEFMNHQWSVKWLHKTIVMSATYRQSSKVSEKLAAMDPNNRLLARGPRFRLTAEMVRDQALAASGLLSTKMSGASVMPPQPKGVWSIVYSGDRWKAAKNEDRYRRAFYTFWRRTSPHPALTTFDAPSREFCVVRRSRTNTPLQALVTLNDPAFLELAHGLARRMYNETEKTTTAQMQRGFRLVLARKPNQLELRRLAKLYQTELEYYKKHPQDAIELNQHTIKKHVKKIDPSQLAALTIVANVILNLDEAMTR